MSYSKLEYDNYTIHERKGRQTENAAADNLGIKGKVCAEDLAGTSRHITNTKSGKGLIFTYSYTSQPP